MHYYLGDSPAGVDSSADVTITLEPGYYYYNYPDDNTQIDHSLDTTKTITVNHGLEWVYRISREPGRLWRRYAKGFVKFSWVSLWELAGAWLGRRGRKGGAETAAQ